MSNHQSETSFFQRSVTSTSARVLGRGIGYFFQFVLARLLAPEAFGLFAIGWSILRLFSMFGHLGLDNGAIYFGQKYLLYNNSRSGSIFSLSLGSALISGVIFGGILYLLSPWLSAYFFNKPELENVLRGFALVFPLVTSLRVLAAISSLSGKMLCGGIAEDIIQPVIQLSILAIMAFNGFDGITSAVFSTVISYTVAASLGLICAKKMVLDSVTSHEIFFQDARPLLWYSIPTVIAVTLASFNLWGDRLLVGYFSTEKNTGIYQSISIITMFTTIILSGIKLAIAPLISRLFNSGDSAQLRNLVKTITRWSLYITLPVLIVTITIPTEIITLAFGSDYADGNIALVWLALGQIFYVSIGVTDIFLLMTGNNSDWLKIASAVFVLTVLLDAIFIPLYGIVGAAIVSCGMMMLMGLLVIFRIKQKFGFWLMDGYHIKIWFAGLVSGGITHFRLQVASHHIFYEIFLVILFSSVLFYFLIFLLGINSVDKKILIDLKKRIFTSIKL